MSLWAELRRRNVVRVAVAYGALGWFLVEVASLSLDAFDAPGWAIKGFILFVALGFPVALVFAWAFELTPEGIKREHEVDRDRSITSETGRRLNGVIIAVLVAIIALLLAERFLFGPAPPEPAVAEMPAASADGTGDAVPGADTAAPEPASPSVAVLPFVNMSGDADNEYFADGITEELLNLLAGIDGLRVPSRTSSFAFKGLNRPIAEIAGELGVAHVLEGSVRKAGDRVRVTAQLIDVDRDAHLWSETYDRDLKDIFAIQDDISGQIVSALQVTLVGGEAPARATPTQNMAAHELYLKGLYRFRNRGDQPSLMPAVTQLEQAVDLDPNFAAAAEALAMVYVVLPGYQTPEERATVESEQALARARLWAERALELDPGLVEARAVQALAMGPEDPVAGLAAFDRLVKEHPQQSTPRLWYAIELMKFGYSRESLVQAQAAVRADPASAINHHHLAKAYHMNGDLDGARRHAQRAVELGRLAASSNIALVSRDEGALEVDLDRLARSGATPLEMEAMRFLVSDAADDPQARQALAARLLEESKVQTEWPEVIPWFWLQLPEPLFDRLPSDAELNVGYILDLLWYPSSAVFRQHPRFQEFARSEGMVALWETRGWPDLCRPQGDGFVCD